MRETLKLCYKNYFVDSVVKSKLEKIILNNRETSLGELVNGYVPSIKELKERFNLEYIEY